jgi:hypothetical protein
MEDNLGEKMEDNLKKQNGRRQQTKTKKVDEIKKKGK